MKVYSAENKTENTIVMSSTGCIILNGHEVGQWKKDNEYGYEGFLFNHSSLITWGNTKHNLIHKMSNVITESPYFKA